MCVHSVSVCPFNVDIFVCYWGRNDVTAVQRMRESFSLFGHEHHFSQNHFSSWYTFIYVYSESRLFIFVCALYRPNNVYRLCVFFNNGVCGSKSGKKWTGENRKTAQKSQHQLEINKSIWNLEWMITHP